VQAENGIRNRNVTGVQTCALPISFARIPYCPSSALIGFTRNVAAELGQYGIRANVVSGGLLKTTDASAVTTPEVFDLIAQSTPLRKVTTPQDVANMVVYLCSEAADGITGQNITVDCRLTMN